jgi:hypothetical protein
MCDLMYLLVVIVCVSGLLYPTFLLLAAFARRAASRLLVVGVAGVMALRGGRGELRRMLWRDLG